MNARRSRTFARVAAAVALLVVTACSDDDDDGPGGSPPTLYQETVLRDPTPTTSP
jgi:hypothetical protein